jgi:hypothetical protein
VPQGRSGRVRKYHPHRNSIPGPSSPQSVQSVAIPTEPPGPLKHRVKFGMYQYIVLILDAFVNYSITMPSVLCKLHLPKNG